MPHLDWQRQQPILEQQRHLPERTHEIWELDDCDDDDDDAVAAV